MTLGCCPPVLFVQINLRQDLSACVCDLRAGAGAWTGLAPPFYVGEEFSLLWMTVWLGVGGGSSLEYGKELGK